MTCISRRACSRVLLLVLLLGLGSSLSAQDCPDTPAQSISSPQTPADVCVPSSFTGNPIQYFDDYSWKAFISMVWPVASGQRGQPDTTKQVGAPGPRVFETFKSVWEIFHADGSAPAAWNVYDDAKFNGCDAAPQFGDVVLASFSKFSELGQAGVGNLVGPIVAQNKTYVRFNTGFNKVEFDQINGSKLYLRANLPAPPNSLTFGNGAVDVKASWILMDNIPNPDRYYTRSALVLDPQTGVCSPQTVGLTGLHIVQKTATRPQWIWTTFEQVDNVPPADPGASGTFTFNDGTAAKMPDANPYPLNPLILPTPAPFNIQRLLPINPSTVKTNAGYRSLLKNAGSVWQFYQLVMTQWPTTPSDPTLPGTPGNTFPGNNPTSAFANVTLETFDQDNIRNGCMNCHNSTRLPTDFLWSLNDHAFPANIPNIMLRQQSFRDLRTLLTSAAPQSKLTAASKGLPASKSTAKKRPKGKK